ncbi:MAG: thiamine pyrophosphate-binding protein [Candidatus Bathyarchaeota archaeon]|nr:thiamine pyrophosphate-binding protein [Candidatus Bathyarchaeota archaeon]
MRRREEVRGPSSGGETGAPKEAMAYETTAEAMMELLKACGVEYIFYNPDTSCVPLTDALAWKEVTKDKPKPIMMLHEFPAVDAAYHYGLASMGQKVGVSMIGGVVGTMNAKGAIYNAWGGYGPCLVLAGMYRMRGTGRRGAHESVDQGGMVREYVKWETEPRAAEQIPSHVARAMREASTEPWGPVYLICNDWLFGGSGHLTGGKLTEPLTVPRFNALGAPGDIPVSQSTAEAAAELFVGAENPLVVSGGMMGRYGETVIALTELAEVLGTPVIAGSVSAHGSKTMNFPTDHPMFMGYDLSPYVNAADLVVVVDQPMIRLPPTTKAILVDWGGNFRPMDYPADLRIHGCSKIVIPQITKEVSKMLEADTDARSRARDRYEKFTAEHDRLKRAWREEAEKAKNKRPIDPIWLGLVLSEVKTDDTIICGRCGGYGYQLMKTLEFTTPGTRFGASSGHMGYGIGGALGAKLARPESPVISLLQDGSFYYGAAGAVFWTASHYNIPVLFINLNDRAYGAITRGLSRYRRWSLKHDYPAGVWIRDPEIRFEEIARANGVWAATIEDPRKLKTTLTEAWEKVTADGKPAFLDVHCETHLTREKGPQT